MRVVILGAGGMLGHDLVAAAPPGTAIFPFSKAELDITATSSLAATVASVRPDVIINAAAYTSVDRAEAERAVAFRVNADAVGQLAQIARRLGIRVVHYSSDYVFDGTATQPYREECPTNPVNTYGASKLAGERALRDSGADFLILRSQWLFGLHGRSFPKTMFERAHAGLATKVVSDQTGRPTSTRDLAKATWMLAGRGATGLFHFANQGEATWFEVAQHVFDRLGRRHLLTPCTTDDYPTPARRPRYSALNTRKIEEVLGSPVAPFETALDDFLNRVVR